MNENLLIFYKSKEEKERKELVESFFNDYIEILIIVLNNILNKIELRNNAYILNLMSKKKKIFLLVCFCFFNVCFCLNFVIFVFTFEIAFVVRFIRSCSVFKDLLTLLESFIIILQLNLFVNIYFLGKDKKK